MDMYKQSFPVTPECPPVHFSETFSARQSGGRRAHTMVTATSSSSDRSEAAGSAVARVAIAGATGFAGQELVRILAAGDAKALGA